VADKDFNISIERARIKLGPFTIDLSQDVFLPKVPDPSTDAVRPVGRDLSAEDKLKESLMGLRRVSAIAKLECLTCHVTGLAYQLQAVLDFMKLHQHHDIAVEELG